MQSFLVRKLVEHRSHLQAKSHSIFYTFSSVLKPSQSQLHQRNHIPCSFLTHQPLHFHSCRSYSSKLRAFLSRPTIPRITIQRMTNWRPTIPPLHEFSRRSWSSWLRRLTSDDVVFGLIIANVAIFLLWRIADEKFMIKNFTISLDNIKSGRLHTLITNAFSHVDPWHIVSNMIPLYFFGMRVGRNFGPEFLLKLYLSGAVVGSVFYLMHQAYKAQTSKDRRAMIMSKELALGASGAVNAVMLLDIFLFPKATIYLDFFIPVPAVLLGIFLIGKDMLRIGQENSKISGSAHLGGAVVAAMAWARVRKGRF